MNNVFLVDFIQLSFNCKEFALHTSYLVGNSVIVASIHPSMGRHFTLIGTISTSAERPGGQSALRQQYHRSVNCAHRITSCFKFKEVQFFILCLHVNRV